MLFKWYCNSKVCPVSLNTNQLFCGLQKIVTKSNSRNISEILRPYKKISKNISWKTETIKTEICGNPLAYQINKISFYVLLVFQVPVNTINYLIDHDNYKPLKYDTQNRVSPTFRNLYCCLYKNLIWCLCLEVKENKTRFLIIFLRNIFDLVEFLNSLFHWDR